MAISAVTSSLNAFAWRKSSAVSETLSRSKDTRAAAPSALIAVPVSANVCKEELSSKDGPRTASSGISVNAVEKENKSTSSPSSDPC